MVTLLPGRRKSNLNWQKIDVLLLCTLFTCKILLFGSILTGICPLWRMCQKLKSTRQQQPEEGGSPRQLLLLGYARTGSSYLGYLLGGYQDVFYAYEPLDALYVSLYGTREGWNSHSDIVYYSNGTERLPSQREISEVTRYINDLFNCETDDFYPEIWLHGFWQKYRNYHSCLDTYISCLSNQRVSRLDFLACQYHLADVCPKQLNWTTILSNDKCPVGILNSARARLTRGGATERYNHCVWELGERTGRCRKHFVEACQQKPVRVVKTIRMTMESVEALIQKNRNLRILHLIRDPRAVVYSRSTFDPSVHGLYSGSPMNEVKEATIYCSIVRRDIAKRKQLERRYPGVLMEVLYEDLVADPEHVIRRIHDFAGITFDTKRRQRLDTTTATWRGDPDRWKERLPDHIIRTIDRVCEGLYQYIPYAY